MSYLEDAVDPFDPATPELDPETPSLAGVLREAMRQTGLGIRVAMPASVTAVHGNQLVDVQPLIKSLYRDGTVALLPVIPQVPVCAPVGASYSVKLPIAVGDTGIALIADRSLDNWMAGSGEPVDPEDCRAHDLCDAMFFPGLVPAGGQTTDQTTDLVLTNGQAIARLQANGRFTFGNGQAELVDLACQLAQSVISVCTLITSQFYTSTALGPMPPLASTVAAASSQKATAQNILTSLQTLKGNAHG